MKPTEAVLSTKLKKNAFPELPFMQAVVNAKGFENSLIKACRALTLEKVLKARLNIEEAEVTRVVQSLIRDLLHRQDVAVLEDDYIDLSNPRHLKFVEKGEIMQLIEGAQGDVQTQKKKGGSVQRTIIIYTLSSLFQILFLMGLVFVYCAVNDAYLRYCEDVVQPRHVWASLARLFKPAPSPMMRAFCQYASLQHQKAITFSNQMNENGGLTVISFMIASGLMRLTVQPDVRNFLQSVLNNISPLVGAGMMPMVTTILTILGATWSASNAMSRRVVNWISPPRIPEDASPEHQMGWRNVTQVAQSVFLEDPQVVQAVGGRAQSTSRATTASRRSARLEERRSRSRNTGNSGSSSENTGSSGNSGSSSE